MHRRRWLWILLGALLLGWNWHSNAPGVRAETTVSHCGAVGADATWAADSVHIVACDVTVAANATLTVAAGAVVKFESTAQLNIEGTLQAVGTSGAPIYFTSIHDDTVGGDTDGEAVAPAVGDWGNIQFKSGSSDASTITRAVIRYSGRDAGTGSSTLNDGAILLTNASPNLYSGFGAG